MSKTKVELNGKSILVTGAPGFIGANLVMSLFDCMILVSSLISVLYSSISSSQIFRNSMILFI